MKVDNYLCTMTEIKSMGFPYLFPGSPPADSDYCVTKLVFGNNFLYNWYYGMMYGYDFSRLPRYQDFLQVKLVISVSKGPLSSPVYDTLFYYQITVSIDGSYPPGPTQDIRITDTLPAGMTLLDFAYVYANGSPVPNPTSGYYTVNIFQSNTASGAFDISLKSGIYAVNRPTFDSYSPITIGFTAKATTTGSLTNTAYATIASGSFTYQTSGSSTVNVPTTTTTTTLVYRNVTIDPRNSLAGSSYTVYINGTADTGWKSGTRTYVTGTVIRVDYSSPACGVLLNSVAYTSGTNTTLTTGVASYTWTLYNAANWTNTGFTCIGNVYYTNQVNDCGGTRQIQTYPGSTCDCICNQNCNGTYNGPSVCLGNDLVQYSYYNCNGNPTGNYTVIQSCSCSCNQACNGTYNGSPYCVGNEQRQDYYYNCNGAYAGTNVLSSCSCSCNAGCNGTYWEYYCTNYGVSPYTQRRRQKYYCNNANTGVDEFVTDCSGSCGVNASPTWNNSGSAYCSGCNLTQNQTQINQCCSTPPYGTTRSVDLGVNSDCGSWNQSYYCEGYTRWSKETNTCTGAIRNQYIVQYDSPDCGYVPPSCGIVWYFHNSGDTPPPLSEAFAYIGCDGESHYVYVYAGDTTTACVLKGTTPGTGSEGDNPYTFGNECNG